MNTEVKFTLEDRELIAPVTALEFDQTTRLFVGEGPYLKIYETTLGRLVTQERVFENQRIHHVKVYDSNGGTKVIVSGGRLVSVLNVQNDESISKIETIDNISFNDWIWDVCLLQGTTEANSSVAVVTGHNAVWIWNFSEDKKWQVSQCKEQCILYCARFIGRTLDHMWCASGTVFNEVLLWKVADNKTSEDKVLVRKRLAGHDGVIFSVRYNYERKLLCSVSDDRSIKVWTAVFLDDFSDVTVSSEPLLTLYGHKARVWDCLILKHHIVSIGEDSMCLLWNSDGEIIRSWKGHIGKSIWSLACRWDEHMVATGGGDGAIRLWFLEKEIEDRPEEEQHLFSSIPSQHEMSPKTEEEIPRMIALLQDSNVLVMTDKGNLYCFVWFQDQGNTCGKWSLIQNEPEFSSYSIMVLSDCRTVVALGNISGSIKLISLTDPLWHPLERKPYTDKVLSLHWLKHEHDNNFNLFSCGPEGLVIWWIVERLGTSPTFSCEMKAKFRLPYCRQRWPNSVFLHGHNTACSESDTSIVLCGDRRGSLHVFKATAETEVERNPVHSLIGIHGRNGVTSICCNSGYIYTTGRGGYIRHYKLCGENLQLLDKKKVYKGMEWIDRVNFTPEGDVLILGFHTVDFIVWSMTRNEVLFRIPCGGGHRNWDLLYNTKDHGIIFTYLKQSTVHVHSWSEIRKQCSSSIQKSFHGRETNCVCFIGSSERKSEETQFHLLATGSEDTTINIMTYNPTKINEQRLRKAFTCEGHISSVRCLAFIKVNSHAANETRSHEHLLFSGGSRASLKCWSLDVDTILNNEMSDKSSQLNTSLNSSCTLLSELRSFSRSSRKKKRLGKSESEEFTCDIRFMSLSVFPLTDLLRSVWTDMDVSPAVGVIAGCSDGLLRFYVFDYQLKTFTLIGQGAWNKRCLLCVGHFFRIVSTQQHLIIYASDTAGFVSFWDVTELYIEYFSRRSKNINNTHMLEEETSYSLNAESDSCVLNNEGLKIGSVFEPPRSNCATDNLRKLKSKEDLTQPFYSHKLHQSGVNAISLVLKENDQYLLCSGGDDGAVTFASFKVNEKDGIIDTCSWSMVSVPNAHTSAATGVKLLENNFAVSASVDQRLKLWKVNWNSEFQSMKLSDVTLIYSVWLDVVDVQDIDVQRDRNGLYYITTSGVGLQMLTIKSISV